MLLAGLNEKTAEINISSNMLNNVRSIHPNAYVYGFTIRYEKKKGLDTSIRGISSTWLIGFQFKKAYRRNGDIFWFKFNNNKLHNQHNLMLKTALSTRRTPMIYYALAAYEDLDAFRNVSPEFLSKTYFIDILHTPEILDNREHKFEVDIATRTYLIHSKSTLGEGSILTWKDILEKIKQKEIGMPIEIFVDNMRKSKQEKDIKIQVGKKTSKTSTQAFALMLK